MATKGMKTKKAAAKRFKLTATGKIKFKPSHMRHILTKKTSNFKRAKRKGNYVHPTHEALIMKCLPFGL
ncbi:MAG: 50S ribosomal protein L35 [Bacteriovoracaceae bacterium]|nr:50S ribosomal protein L35 [Bacteriovoracaceae bacterium]